MSEHRPSRRGWWWRWPLRASAILMFFPLLAANIEQGLSYRTCVQLPNGLLLDSDGLFNSNRRFGATVIILKNPDGTVVVAEPITYMLVTETTVLGITEYVAKRKRYV